ncbi:MAG: AbrB/MazE/SpoVT family DNA-binding domain-containing protein [Thermoanaerobaculales bacterium]|nr:AbrB/MazE/SpoVT family DNA-binding domain-containing protein [Thermoanaerobaculales bacterium]
MVSKVSSKGQVTIPVEVRSILGIRPGDFIEYEIQEDGGAMLRRVSPFDAVFHNALNNTLEEWASAEDDEAFSDL